MLEKQSHNVCMRIPIFPKNIMMIMLALPTNSAMTFDIRSDEVVILHDGKNVLLELDEQFEIQTFF